MKESKSTKILIVEDEVLISEQLNVTISELGFQVTDIAFNKESAIESLKTNPPDLAILDIKMHGKNQGFEIAKYINDQMNIPFIFLTSFADESTVDEASNLFPEGYIVKPFNEKDINTTLKVALKRYAKKSKTSPQYNPLLFTDTEIKILHYISLKLSSSQIAEKLFISKRTVEKHRSNIVKKLGIESSQFALIRWVEEHL